MYEDKELKCIDAEINSDCEKEFTFTAGEQEYFEDRGLSAPKRCPSCRAKKRAQREANGEKPYQKKSGRFTRDNRRENY